MGSFAMRSWWVWLFAGTMLVAACTEEQYPLGLWEAQHPLDSGTADSSSSASSADAGRDAAATEAAGPPAPATCFQAAAQPLPQRLVTMSAHASAGSNLIGVLELFTRFDRLCGACHGPASDRPGLGSFRIANDVDFQTIMTAAILAHVTSDGGPQDPDPMPPFASPAGGPYSKRSPTDPIVQFATLVQAWLAAGSPPAFAPPQAQASDQGADGGDGGAMTSSFSMTSVTGNALTNIGNCIPHGPLMTLAATQKKGVDLDARFAGLSKKVPGSGVTPAQLVGLPERLRDTDLFTFDSGVLAQYGVTAFQPAYPLWSDDAGKLRHVRVPIGQSIQFDKTKQEFVIPDNTRFYKTFLKRIVDTDGSIRWRKIETRLIVARHDTTQNADGTPRDCTAGACVNALFGSYQWNADESDAVLIETPLVDGLPFADTVLLYTADEQLAADLLSQNPANPDEVLVRAGAARHYAIPSSDRCIQCHMGSPSQSFVLGFRPVQINRRPPGYGGITTEPNQQQPTADELTQLQRFIDYGIITGMSSPADVLPLEQSEGSRQPRNLQELTAQGYMVGNCAHCHNPHGFPSVTNPVLVDVFNLLPGPNGGIFQFPLEKVSPRITRGLGGGVQVPYITPSLMDLSSSAKYVTPTLDDNGNPAIGTIAYAPWRSLIYRNTDTPFTYTDDYGLFPHMPMNAPGFDCRTKQIMSDWMVSIPAIRKHPEIPEYTLAFVNSLGGNATETKFIGGAAVDDTPQPYVEVAPGTPGYDDAVLAAQQRLKTLHTGINPAITSRTPYVRYADCPDNSDILDPEVLRDATCHPVPTVPDVGDNGTGAHLGVPTENLDAFHVPAHAHWVVTDLTQIAGTYSPRRADWASVVVDQKFPPASVACQDSNVTDAQNAQDEVKLVVDELQHATLDQVRDFATKDFPMGLWQAKPGCDFSSVPTLGSWSGPRLQWMDHATQASPGDPLYAEWPGAAVFNMICVNCHGPQADAHGRLADNLLTMTGGNARVANLRDGFFGPVSMPGANRQAPFGMLPSDADAGWTSTGIDDRAARYMAWMGAGGTEVTIPQSILQIVSNTAVLGETRQLPSGAQASANMLSVAKSLCYSLLFGNTAPSKDSAIGSPVHQLWYSPDANGREEDNPALITANGDAELWLRLCRIANPPPVRAVHGSLDGDYHDTIVVGGTGNDVRVPRLYSTDLFPQDIYGANPVGNDRGLVDQGGITPDNLRPWCYRVSSAGPNETPVCPPSIDDNGPARNTGAQGLPSTLDANTFKPQCTNGCWGPEEADRWATRGAINAGFAVFLYLNAASKGKARLPDYTQCQELH